ncbi:hypothetical protein T4C_1538 [Trichinella pseudospiralis]|uniref:Uncharacterized protein n=1 Tax=Trichinella pseudospiralis TaxID=6337 RepID=A0A0V1K8L0_TRIPS|nr:hypothetical protein T4C_1538 [Trichinella pseudospiralis]
MEQQRRQPRPQVGGGTVSVALCSASLDGQWYSFKISASTANEQVLRINYNFLWGDVGRIVCSFCTLKTLRFACLTNNFSLLSLIGYGRSIPKFILHGQCLLVNTVVNRVIRRKKKKITIQYPMSNEQGLSVE